MEISGDIDLTNKSATLQGQVPGFPGAAGEILIVGTMAYIRKPGETKYTGTDASSLAVNPADPAGAASYVVGMVKIAADPHLKPELVGTEDIYGSPCYHVRVNMDPAVANSILTLVGSTLGTGQLDLWIMQDGFRVAMMEFYTSDPKAGSAAFRLILTNYDAPLHIQAPPNDQWDLPNAFQ